MFAEERQDRILKMLHERKSVSVQELSAALFVSTATVRRDLTRMERMGLIRRSHGGAVLYERTEGEFSISVRELEHTREKKRIAELALRLMQPGGVVFMDSSSTAGMLVPLLSQQKHLTIITNGLKNAQALADATDAQIYIPGGIVSPRSNSAVGSDAVTYISRLHAQIAFVSCAGIDVQFGVTDVSSEQAAVKRAMLARADTRVLLCDSAKFDLTFLCRTCALGELDYIVTDKRPQEVYLRAAQEANCQIIWQ